MNSIIRHIKLLVPAFLVLMLAVSCISANAQSNPVYTIKNGNMYVEISKTIGETSLDSFIHRYSLSELRLKDFIQKSFIDSIIRNGWDVLVNNKSKIVISKKLIGFDEINNPAKRIQVGAKQLDVEAEFPVVSNNVRIGHNVFRNKEPFQISKSIVKFYLKGYKEASRVMLAGSFNNWEPDVLAMVKTDSGWISEVSLRPGKYWYKFIVNGNWITDPDNLITENDGRGNINSIFYFTNAVFTLKGYNDAREAYLTGSFVDWKKQISMKKTPEGWSIPVYLAEGTHSYRFVVDGKSILDPSNQDKLPGGSGEPNSVVRLGTPHMFFLKGYPNAREVIVAGSFNQWRSNELYLEKTTAGWKLDYTMAPGNYEYRYRVDGLWIDSANNASEDMSKVTPAVLILSPNYTFRLKKFPGAKTVYLAGDFNNWNPSTMPMTRQGDEWVYSVNLTPGKHQYKFIVDGKWIIDPDNKLWEQNEFNTGNSVIWIEKK